MGNSADELINFVENGYIDVAIGGGTIMLCGEEDSSNCGDDCDECPVWPIQDELADTICQQMLDHGKVLIAEWRKVHDEE